MKVIHSVELSHDECDEIYQLAKAAGEIYESTAYAMEEKPALIEEAKRKFKATVAAFIHEAFVYGYNEGINKANDKDTEMYKPAAKAY